MDRQNEERNIKYLWSMIDFILWRDWDPIGGGGLGLPRDEYSGYVGPVVDVVLSDRNELAIAALLQEFQEDRMALPADADHCLEIARKVLAIPVNGRLSSTVLRDYVDLMEGQLWKVFEIHGQPTRYYFFEGTEERNRKSTVDSSEMRELDHFLERWNEIIELGMPRVEIIPMGYWEQAFVSRVDFDPKMSYSVPYALTEVAVMQIRESEWMRAKPRLEDRVDIRSE